MKKLYKVNYHNSTCCGYPGRGFDWSKFCWDGSELHDYGDAVYSGTKDKLGIQHCPIPWVDNGFISKGSEYLHVPYDWKEAGTIYRVRPNPTMEAGEVYRGKLIKRQRAVKLDDGWYWELTFEK